MIQTTEEEIVYRRGILLDETRSDTERRIAQKRLMEILDIKEKETDGECTPERIKNIKSTRR